MLNTAKNQIPDIILASKSPRRIRMLKEQQIDFMAVDSGVDENTVSAACPEGLVKKLAVSKAWAVSADHPDRWVIGADSVVVVDGRVLNKPDSREHARQMLIQLSGRTHRVMTGFAVIRQTVGHRFADVVISEVSFKTLGNEEIDWYTGLSEPYDKAGSYAVQGIGAFMVKRINGSYTNVVGLPLAEVLNHLAACGALHRIKNLDHEPATGGRAESES